MSDTARWALPLLDAGQAQKEMTHNEAVTLLDLLAGASVVAVGTNVPPSSSVAGQCWVIGTAPTGAWAAQAQALVGWTAGGWRFLAPRDGLAVWSAADGCLAVFDGGQWRVGRVAATELFVGGVRVVGARQPAIALPAGGGTVDVQARAAIAALLTALTTHGLIAP